MHVLQKYMDVLGDDNYKLNPVSSIAIKRNISPSYLYRCLNHIKYNYPVIYKLKYARYDLNDVKKVISKINYSKISFDTIKKEFNLKTYELAGCFYLFNYTTTNEIDTIDKLRQERNNLTDNEKLNNLVADIIKPKIEFPIINSNSSVFIEYLDFKNPNQFIDNIKLVTSEYNKLFIDLQKNKLKIEDIDLINSLKNNIEDLIVTFNDNKSFDKKYIIILEKEYNNISNLEEKFTEYFVNRIFQPTEQII